MIPRMTQMMASCVNCQKFQTYLCKYEDRIEDEYKDTCSRFIMNKDFGFGTRIDEEDAVPVLKGNAPKLDKENAMDRFNDYVSTYGMEEAVRILVNNTIELEELTCSLKLTL